MMIKCPHDYQYEQDACEKCRGKGCIATHKKWRLLLKIGLLAMFLEAIREIVFLSPYLSDIRKILSVVSIGLIIFVTYVVVDNKL